MLARFSRHSSEDQNNEPTGVLTDGMGDTPDVPILN
jgi:hypothetical protein